LRKDGGPHIAPLTGATDDYPIKQIIAGPPGDRCAAGLEWPLGRTTIMPTAAGALFAALPPGCLATCANV
jgi:hypothetical protein